jgi:hypothetical protein
MQIGHRLMRKTMARKTGGLVGGIHRHPTIIKTAANGNP